MSTVYVVGQLPIKLRYTEWFTKTVYDALKDSEKITANMKVVNLMEQSSYNNSVHLGRFRDSDELFADLLKFDTDMLKVLSRQVFEKGDIVITCDTCTTGIIPLWFSSNPILREKVKLLGFYHGSSFNYMDIYPKSRNEIDKMLLMQYDGIFCFSNYSRRQLQSTGIRYPTRIVLLGFPNSPFYLHPFGSDEELEIQWKYRKYDVAIVDRDSPQKRTNELLDILTKEHGISFFDVYNEMHTSLVNKCARDYFTLLLQTKVVLITSKADTYGIQIQDAQRCGCHVLCPTYYLRTFQNEEDARKVDIGFSAERTAYTEFLTRSCFYNMDGSSADIAWLAQTIKELVKNSGKLSSRIRYNAQDTAEFGQNLAQEVFCFYKQAGKE